MVFYVYQKGWLQLELSQNTVEDSTPALSNGIFEP